MSTPESIEELDLNKIAIGVIQESIEGVYEKLKNAGIAGMDGIRVRLKTAYTNYIKKITKEYSNVRSFFLRDEQAYLYKFYIPVSAKCGKKVIDRVGIEELEAISRSVVICGQAGCGKSILLKHLLLDSIHTARRIPVFCELKDFNDSTTSVHDLIKCSMADRGFTVDESAFDLAFFKGHFAFLFDGYDELDPLRRSSIGEEIRAIATKYENCLVVLTSRPDPEFSGWHGFSRVDVLPLSLSRSCELVEKLDFNTGLKERFIDDLRGHLYAQHTSFLSNPLLLTIMLLTYDENADISGKLSVFYSQAYEVLYQRHDARKRAYKRKKRSKLDIQDFAKVFSAFCLVTYDKRQFKFSEAEAIGYLGKAREVVEINFNAQDFLSDLMQAVCLIIEDGIYLTFSHRSFQEYFVARFINEASADRKEILIARYQDLIRRDNTIALLYEMDPHIVEKVVIIPIMGKMLERVGRRKKQSITSYLKYLSLIYNGLSVDGDQIIGYINTSEASASPYDIVVLLLRRLGHLHGYEKQQKYDKKLIESLSKRVKQNTFLPISKLKARDELAIGLFNSDSFQGGKTFEKLLSIYSTIELRHKNRVDSLDDILKSPRRTPLLHHVINPSAT